MNIKSMKKSLIWTFVFSLVVLSVFLVFGDLQEIVKAVLHFDFNYIYIILIVMPINFLVRFLKYCYYLKIQEITIPLKDKVLIYLSGLCMSVTPAKLGELIRPYMLKQKYGIPISKTSPFMIAERGTDGLAMILLALISFGGIQYNPMVIYATLSVLLIGIVIIQQKRFCYFVLDRLAGLKLIQKYVKWLRSFYDSSFILLKWRAVFVGIVTGLVAWTCEAVVLYFTLLGFGSSIGFMQALFIISMTAILAGVTMLPGGIGISEGSIVGLLIFIGIPTSIGTSAALVSRFSTLWLGVLVGLFAIYFSSKNQLLYQE